MTVQHSDGTVCMADVWKQSAELLQARAESAEARTDDHAMCQMSFDHAMGLFHEERDHSKELEAIVTQLWEFIPLQEPSAEFKAKVEGLIARLQNPDTDDR